MLFIGAFWAVTSGKLNMSTLPSLAIQLNNTFGLFCVLTLLGYGLVAIPRRLWKQSDPTRELRHHLYRCALHRFYTPCVPIKDALKAQFRALALSVDTRMQSADLGRSWMSRGRRSFCWATP